MIEGIFIQEKKNRFLSEVLINDKICECYIPSSCHLSNFIDLRGKHVFLLPIKSKNTRTRYKVFSLATRYGQIPLELALANRVVEAEIKRRLFCFLGKRNKVQREITIDGYKSDLFISDTNTLIEIKSVLTTTPYAVFPTVYSERAIQQLQKIEMLQQKGFKACYCFVSLNPGVKQIIINNEVPEFYSSLQKCVDNGMMVVGYSLCVKDGKPILKRRINVEFKPGM